MIALISIETDILPNLFPSVKMASRTWKIRRNTRGCCGSILKTKVPEGMVTMLKPFVLFRQMYSSTVIGLPSKLNRSTLLQDA